MNRSTYGLDSDSNANSGEIVGDGNNLSVGENVALTGLKGAWRCSMVAIYLRECIGWDRWGFGWMLCNTYSIEAKAARHDVPAGCSVRWRESGSQVLNFFAFASSGPSMFPHLVEITNG